MTFEGPETDAADAEGGAAPSRRVSDLLFFSMSGSFISFVLHASFFATLSTIVIDMSTESAMPAIDMRVEKPKPPEEPEEVIPYELADPNDTDYELREVVNAKSVGQSITTNPRPESAPTPPTEELVVNEFRNAVYDIPEGLEIDKQLVVKGHLGEGLIQIESAMDRITSEIAQNLQERKVLVVWMIDGSASLIGQRQAMAKRLKRVYGELDALENIGQVPRRKQPILTGVVAFGNKTEFMTREPTDKFDEVIEAFNAVPTDPSGVENIFTAVGQVMNLWKKYRANNGRRIMLIVVTDEAGDDFGPPLEKSIKICRRNGAKAYVVGPSAVFGKRNGHIPYVAPEDGKTYQLPIALGPETAMMENVTLPFWYGGSQLQYLSSGFAPYALARLVHETGGTYFMTDMTTMTGFSPQGVFDHSKLEPFVPDYRYGSREEFLAMVKQHPLRLAVIRGARASEEFTVEGTPTLELRVTPADFRNVCSQAQQQVARSQLMLDNILMAFPKGLDKELPLESSLRWRMAFCLSYGRLLAQRVRCLEYNLACAHLKGAKTEQDVRTKSNHWIFRPDETIRFAVSYKGMAKKANQLLERVVEEAPGTPWAALASRELRDSLGIRIEERFIPPPTPQQLAAAAAARNRVLFAPENRPRQPAPTPKPKPKPKLPRF